MRHILVLLLAFFTIIPLVEACPLDHLKIGRNPDGIDRTDDDMKLFFDVTQKYRHSDPNGADTWLNWYYPMTVSELYQRRQVGEPGFDVLKDGSNQELIGQPNQDYRLIVECVALSPGLQAFSLNPPVNITQPGDSFCHSCASDPHIHVRYEIPMSADPNQPYWITYRVYDELEMYQPSEPVTIVFMNAPPAGDLTLDGMVGLADLLFFMDYWLDYSDATRYNVRGQAAYDLFERADINRDYAVDMADFAILARHWLEESEPDN